MRKLLLSLVILSIVLNVASASYGNSRIQMVRAWTVDGAEGVPIDFQGAVSVNNSNQNIVSVSTVPPMQQEMRDGVMWVEYNGTPTSDHLVLTATVIVDIDYDPNITSDSAVPGTPLNSTNLTEADDAVSGQARLLENSSSSLDTIRTLTDWVHKNVIYDLSYWGHTKSAIQAFNERRGVCVEYTHLLIAMARSLGFDTKYVTGYIYVNGWQQHAWAEILVPGYGWLPADATFGQVGIMDDTHYGIQYADDQSGAFDTLNSTSTTANLSVQDTPSVVMESTDAKGVSMSMSLDNKTLVADVTLNNSRPGYVYGSYAFQAPQNYNANNYGIMLLKPNQIQHIFQPLNSSFFQSGLIYTVPLSVSFNDVAIERNIQIEGATPSNASAGTSPPSACPSAIIMLAISSFLAFRSRP